MSNTQDAPKPLGAWVASGRRPRLLDAFSGAGGCAVGYHRAGFDVTGVDIAPMPRFPFTFVQGDALEYIAAHGHEYDAIAASPPCQAYTSLRALQGDKEYPDLVAATRDALQTVGRPYIIENVPGAPLNANLVLCGSMFPGLRVYRHRLFETSFYVWQPQHPKHVTKATGNQRKRKAHYEAGGFITITGDVGSYCGNAMDINWMTGNELSQAIPPAYTAYIGHALISMIVMKEAS